MTDLPNYTDELDAVLSAIIDLTLRLPYLGSTQSLEQVAEIIDMVIDCNHEPFELVFEPLYEYLKPKAYWKILRYIYGQSHGLYHCHELVRDVFSAPVPCRYALMTKAERDYIKTLPNEITIHRAMTVQEFESDVNGVSWTMDYDTAVRFRDEIHTGFTKTPLPKTIKTLTIKKSKAVAYFGGVIDYIHELIDVEHDNYTCMESEIIYLG